VREWFRRVPPAPERAETPVQLEARDLRFAYRNGHEALHDLSLTVHEGEISAIVGTNGAGKTTFCKLLCGFETQQEGTLLFSGADMAALSIKERAESIGYVMQDPNQMISQTMIYDEVALGLRTRKVPEDEIRPRVEEALKVCGLWPFRNWPVSALSFGQKKRVTIASILVLQPKVILLDEPTAGQDYRHYTEIMEFLLDLNRRGITVLMVTHDMHLMLEYARRAIVFSDGQLIADAPRKDKKRIEAEMNARLAALEDTLETARQHEWLVEKFGEGEYQDVLGLCKVATIQEIEEKNYSLTPGAYVGVAEQEDDGVDFHERMNEIHDQLAHLNTEANALMTNILEAWEDLK
jgi:energy-coupling factor transporter ATP-binding protein EcfA2